MRSNRQKQPCLKDEITLIDGFLSPKHCSEIIEELQFSFWKPSYVTSRLMDGSLKSAFSRIRVSRSTDQFWFTAPLNRRVCKINLRLEKIIAGFNRRAEPWQATSYSIGGKFDFHFDSGHWKQDPAGDRELTVLIYLDSPKRGGSTLFKELDLSVKATAGRLLIWRNLDSDGSSDPRMLHCSTPLLRGRKTVLVTWVRERALRPACSS